MRTTRSIVTLAAVALLLAATPAQAGGIKAFFQNKISMWKGRQQLKSMVKPDYITTLSIYSPKTAMRAAYNASAEKQKLSIATFNKRMSGFGTVNWTVAALVNTGPVGMVCALGAGAVMNVHTRDRYKTRQITDTALARAAVAGLENGASLSSEARRFATRAVFNAEATSVAKASAAAKTLQAFSKIDPAASLAEAKRYHAQKPKASQASQTLNDRRADKAFFSRAYQALW